MPTVLPPPPPSLVRSSNVYFAFFLIVLGVSLVYGIFQFRTLQAETLAVTDNEHETLQLTDALSKVNARFHDMGDSHAKKLQDFSKKVESILPIDENYTDLTRLFDNFFAENDTPSSPIFQSSLRFGKGMPASSMPGISALPVSMNIDATRDNFLKFLDFVNNSGSLENGTRIMEINSIQLNFPEGGEIIKDPRQKMNFTVDMNVYYQTPKVAR